MRNDLKAQGLTEIETDVDERKVFFKTSAETDVEQLLNGVAESNDKLKDWVFIEQ